MPNQKKTAHKSQLPYRTEWNLGLMYESTDDPQIEVDMLKLEKLYTDFATKYKNQDFTKDEQSLYDALKDYEALTDAASSWKPILYFYLAKDIESGNSLLSARFTVLEDRAVKSANKIVFFPIIISKISDENKKKYLASEVLKPFRYFLKTQFRISEHMLSEPEEKILALKAKTSNSMWVDGFQKVLQSKTLKYKNRIIPVTEAVNLLSDVTKKDRHYLWQEIIKICKSTSEFAEHEINAIILDKKVNDELRHLEKPYSSTIIDYQNDEKVVLEMISTITQNFNISKKFYSLKAKILGGKDLRYEDRLSSIGKTEVKIPFEKGVEMVKAAFSKVDKKYADYLDSYLRNGQIDVYPRKGKIGGGYCLSSHVSPTFVLLNHTNSLDSVSTLAHEMGHAFHSELSEVQSPLYRSYTISVAEVASTFFESIFFDDVLESLPEHERVVALHDRIDGDVSTVFRQTALINLEMELHDTIRKEGFVPAEKIGKIMAKHMNAYIGDAFPIGKDDGYGFVFWAHIRYFFYSYSYAFGQLISKALYARYKKDKSYLKQIEAFLSAGGSKSPEDIFADIGIDVRDPQFFVDGLKQIEADIARLESLVKVPPKKKSAKTKKAR